jgi:ATP-binding cassette subfamily B protein
MQEALFLPIFKAYFTLEQEKDEGLDIPPGRLEVAFEDVWFRYPGGTEDVLRGLTFSFGEGDHLALVGLNGAGKTTILRLLMRVYDPTQGRITVNGVDLRELRPSAWRRALAVMGQDSNWFEDSVHNEVLNGDLSAGEDAERLGTAVTVSGLGEVIKDLPRGIDTVVGRRYSLPEDEAIQLSGGQNQIVTIARTVYRNARAYVFDEPTSAVDAEKEERFFSALPEALDGRALLFVSHRFSTLRRAKRIIVVDSGHIIEDGSHEELMAKQGRYAELFTLQAKMYQ